MSEARQPLLPEGWQISAGEGPEIRRLSMLGKKIAGALASTALLVGCSVIENTEPAADVAPESKSTLFIPDDIVTIGGDRYCNNRYHRGDLAPKKLGTVVVDGRCAIDSDNDVGIYGGINYQHGLLATAKTGAVLVALCFETGEPIQNLAGEPFLDDKLSGRWVRVKLEQTYTPKSNIRRNRPYLPAETPTIPATWLQGVENVTQKC